MTQVSAFLTPIYNRVTTLDNLLIPRVELLIYLILVAVKEEGRISIILYCIFIDRNAFRVFWTTEDEEGSSHTLVAPDEHTKRQWVTVITRDHKLVLPYS